MNNVFDIVMTAALTAFVVVGLVTAGMTAAIVTGVTVGGSYLLFK
ncbi:hypothetical protein [Pseudoalteromonas spongiae]